MLDFGMGELRILGQSGFRVRFGWAFGFVMTTPSLDYASLGRLKAEESAASCYELWCRLSGIPAAQDVLMRVGSGKASVNFSPCYRCLSSYFLDYL